jgi:preprotein translocase subunit SecD
MLWMSAVILGNNLGFTLTLAGIAGAIVAVGITADSFIIYFERLRDEIREGRSLRSAVESAWIRARRTIIISDVVSLIAAALLFIFAIGGVRGFAFMLGLTTLIDLIVIFLFTKPIITLLANMNFFASGHKLSGLDSHKVVRGTMAGRQS